MNPINDPVKLAIIDQHPSQAIFLKKMLDDGDKEICLFEDFADFRQASQVTDFDVVILNLDAQDQAPTAFTEDFRSNHGWECILFCHATALNEEDAADIIRAGADGFMPAPLQYLNLSARIDALVRRQKQHTKRLKKVGQLSIDIEHRKIYDDKGAIKLTNREYNLAHVFFENIGQLLRRDELRTRIWSDHPEVSLRNIDTHISRLRKKLGLTGSKGVSLNSLYGLGYRMDTTAETTPKQARKEPVFNDGYRHFAGHRSQPAAS